MNKFIIITTINPITKAIEKFKTFKDWQILLIGDKKSKIIQSEGNLTFLSIEDQKQLDFSLIDKIPYNSYARKNIGYLYAIQHGAEIIYDSDDDNIPYDYWSVKNFTCKKNISSQNKFLNIYKYFIPLQIWPRGFPLDEILTQNEIHVKETESINIGAWQGLVDNDPDVDAIYRLILNHKIKFQNKPSVYLDKWIYCPINSQNTFWNKNLFISLYLPFTTRFRCCDIIRGYISQRLMWERNLHLGFTKANIYQERNKHDLMKDFKDEIECYINIKKIIQILDFVKLGNNMAENLYKIYLELVKVGLIKKEELDVLKLWINEIKRLRKNI